LCKEYPAFTPFVIDESSFSRVIQLFAETRQLQINDEKNHDPETGDEIIRVRAGDNWF
jgi:hypothetical protein